MSRRHLAPCATLALALAAAAPAQAQVPNAQPAPQASPGSATMSVAGGAATKRTRYFARGQDVLVTGTVKPYVPGQTVTLSVIRKGGVIVTRTSAVTPGRRGTGAYKARFRAPRATGTLRLVVKHDATPQQAAFRAGDRRIQVVRWTAGSGAVGTRILLLQRGLRQLGYAVPANGRFDGATARAVLAFRKVNELGRTGFAAAGVFDRVLNRRGAFKLRHPRAGRHVEFDWSRQVLVLARNGRPWRTYHSSSGKPSTPTVFGAFRFYRKQPGTNSHGMVHSSYFIGGYAIHGYVSVPNYPASHGCLRVPIPDARSIYDNVKLGERIFVYR